MREYILSSAPFSLSLKTILTLKNTFIHLFIYIFINIDFYTGKILQNMLVFEKNICYSHA